MHLEILSQYGRTYVCVLVFGTITQDWDGVQTSKAIDSSLSPTNRGQINPNFNKNLN